MQHVIANPAGLHTYAPPGIHYMLHLTLQRLNIHGYQLGHTPVAYIGPTPNFKSPPGFKVAQHPAYPAPVYGPHQSPILQYTKHRLALPWGHPSLH